VASRLLRNRRTSIAVSGDRALPPPTAEFERFVTTVEVDRSDPGSVIECLVDDFRAAQNHDLLHDEGPSRDPLSSISAPTLVIYGTADPMLPIDHGEAVAEEIHARLLRLDGAGHGVYRADWEAIVAAILEHT
jgi:pimeloyl-ACP methyl ester carboxylesterase